MDEIFKMNFKKATELKATLDELRPLSPESENRIMQKLRLDWNYHSSHIEGNQLTYGETKALILFGTTAQAKPLKDHLEMTGHNEAILNIEEVIKQERPLSESFIRELHELILKEPYEVNAITPDGNPTKRTILVGKYKKVPNHVKTQTGEILYFATPEETPAEMGDLMKWYSDNKDSQDIHPVEFATEFHYRFIRIHPFDDGNGRISRLLMNFILMQKGYPPAIIKTEDKTAYYNALQQADADILDFFFNYICVQVVLSLEIMIKGAKGENIDEEDDLDKKLALLKQEIKADNDENEIKTRLTYGVLLDSLNLWGFNLFEVLTKTTLKFNEFYDKPEHKLFLNIMNKSFSIEIGKDELKSITSGLNSLSYNKEFKEVVLRFQTSYGAYIQSGLTPVGCTYKLELKFTTYNYEIFIDYFNKEESISQTKSYAKKLLHKPLMPDEIKEIDKQWGDTLFMHLDYWSKHKESKI